MDDRRCVECGLSLNADTNAAINIARRGAVEWRVQSTNRTWPDPQQPVESKSYKLGPLWPSS